MSRVNGSANGTTPALRRDARDMTAALRMRRYRKRKNNKENNGSVTASPAASVTLSTAQICALGARLSDGRASQDDLRMADRIIVAFAMQFPPDSLVEIGTNEIPAETEPE